MASTTEEMYALMEDDLPVTKVILADAGHAFYADDYEIDYDRPSLPDDTVTTTDPLLPDFDGLLVQEATAEFFLAHLT